MERETWCVRAWFDEGEGYESQPGPVEEVEAESWHEAVAELERRNPELSSVEGWDAKPKRLWRDDD